MNRRQLLLGASAAVLAKMAPVSPPSPATLTFVGGRTVTLPPAASLSKGMTFKITNSSDDTLWINMEGVERILLPGDRAERLSGTWTSTRDPA